MLEWLRSVDRERLQCGITVFTFSCVVLLLALEWLFGRHYPVSWVLGFMSMPVGWMVNVRAVLLLPERHELVAAVIMPILVVVAGFVISLFVQQSQAFLDGLLVSSAFFSTGYMLLIGK